MNAVAKIDSMDEAAKRIRKLAIDMATNVISLGIELKHVQDTKFTRSNNKEPFLNESGVRWNDWIRDACGIEAQWAHKLILIGIKFHNKRLPPNTGMYVLAQLSKDNVPEAAVNEVIDRTERGERVGRVRADEIIQKHLPTPAQAIKQAQETGRLTAARDGNVYSGKSEDEIAAYSIRRRQCYAIREAIATIANCPLDPKQWVDGAEEHWLKPMNIGEVETATKWLNKLSAPLTKRLGIINA